MNAFKQLVVFAVLAVVGIGLYFKIQGDPEPIPPMEAEGDWGTPPSVEVSNDEPAGLVGPVLDGSGSTSPPPTLGRASPTADQAGPTRSSGHSEPSLPRSLQSATPGSTPATDPRQGPRSIANIGSSDRTTPAGVASHAAGATPEYNDDLYGRNQTATVPPNRTVPDGAGIEGNSPPAGPYGTARREAQEALDRGQLAEALLMLSRWHAEPTLSPADRRELDLMLGQLAGTVIYSKGHYLAPAHIVQNGESLPTIAAKYNVPWQLLAKINGLTSPDQIKPGDELKVVRGPFSVVVQLDARELTLMVSGYYAGKFSIGVGTERPNMAGLWVVRHKEQNPTYYGPDRVVDQNDPTNPLGEHWIGLASADNPEVVRPLGIHGTQDSANIHQPDPRGYIRLTSHDVADLFDIVSIGSRVTIRR